jgi:uncharacterized protein DUF3597
MSISGTIMSKIFGASKTPAAPASASGSTGAAGACAACSRCWGNARCSCRIGGRGRDPRRSQRETSEELDWRKSIVDLMKLVGLDSSLTARKQLAAELNYKGDTSDSASMNIWLHKQMMAKIAANGGKLPADLAH